MLRNLSRSLVALVLLLIPNAAWAMPAQYSAEFTMSMAGGMQATGKMMIKNDNLRLEVGENGAIGIFITRGDRQVAWNIHPSTKQYYETSHPDFNISAQELKTRGTEVGTENYRGLDCKIYQHTEALMKMTIKEWVSTQYDIPVQIEVARAEGDVFITMQFYNINFGEVDNNLFELPAGYSKVESPELD